jgi:hypothetical protein
VSECVGVARSPASRARLAALCLVACGARAPSPIDVAELTARLGNDGARRALVARILADPRDVQARLGLAALADRTGRPGEAIEQLDVVVALGGPLGARWHDDDRARLARLLLSRGQARLARDASTALADLVRAGELGAEVPRDDLARAHVAHAVARLRHVDLAEREAGRRELAERSLVRDRAVVDPEIAGAHDAASPVERAEYGVWLWQHGARRAASDELTAWHEQTVPPRDPALAAAYVRALTWWTPSDGPPPPPDALAEAGPAQCRISGCAPVATLDTPGERELALAQPSQPATDPADALAWLAIELAAAARGDVALGPALRARVDPGLATSPAAAPVLRWALAYVAGAAPAAPPPGDRVAAARAAAVVAQISADASDAAGVPAGHDARAAAAVRYARARVPAADERGLLEVAEAYRRDPAVADRLVRDVIARSVDRSAAEAEVAALFDALSDPGRARPAWQAAVDAGATSDPLGTEPAFAEGLAEAMARGNDPDAALIAATGAAAASGDPGAVWARVARVLVDSGHPQHALSAVRFAVDLAGPDALAPALDAAIDASRVLGRLAQVEALRKRRAAAWPPAGGDVAADPTDPVTALAGEASLDRVWIASRWAPRDVATRAAVLRLTQPSDGRHVDVVAELVALAGDPDALRGLAAATSLP